MHAPGGTAALRSPGSRLCGAAPFPARGQVAVDAYELDGAGREDRDRVGELFGCLEDLFGHDMQVRAAEQAHRFVEDAAQRAPHRVLVRKIATSTMRGLTVARVADVIFEERQLVRSTTLLTR